MLYELHIHRPNNKIDDAFCILKSETPFMAINAGDLLNPRSWMSGGSNIYDENPEFEFGTVLRVTSLEHIIIQLEDETITRHQIMIFTEGVEDLEESRK